MRRTAQQIGKKLDEAHDAAQQNIPAQNVQNQLPGRTLPPASSTSRGGVLLSDDDPQPVGAADPGTLSAASRADHVHGGGGTVPAGAPGDMLYFDADGNLALLEMAGVPAFSAIYAEDVGGTQLPVWDMRNSLAGDLSGTFDAALVTGLQGFPISTSDPTTGMMLIYDGGAYTPRVLVAADIPSLTAAKISDFDTQVRTSRIDQLAAAGANVSLGSHKLINVLDPTADQDAATKAYVDAVAQGLSVKGSARLATAVALPSNSYTAGVLTGSATGVLTVDGSAVALNDRILVKDEATQANNGLYVCTTAGAVGVAYVLTRAADQDAATEIAGAFAFVEGGTANAGAGFVVAGSGPYVVGTTAIVWTQFSGAGEISAGTGLTKTGNTLSISASYLGQGSITTLGTIGTGSWQGTKIGLAYGGTNADLAVTGGAGQYLKQSSSGAAITVGAIPATDLAYSGLTTGQIFQASGATAAGFAALNLATAVSITGILPSANGGTGQSSYAVGDLLYASGSAALSKLAGVAIGNALISGGVTTAPAWGKIGLTTHVSGLLPSANGGSGTNNTGNLAWPSGGGTAALLGTAQTFSDEQTLLKTLHVPASTSTNSTYGIRFGDSGTDYGNFQTLDLGGASYIFFSTNRQFNGATGLFELLNTRVGGNLQISSDALAFFTFAASSVTPTNRWSVDNAGNMNAQTSIRVGGTQVLTSRQTGWNAPTGTLTRGTFAVTGATVASVAQALAALITDARTHGWIGT